MTLMFSATFPKEIQRLAQAFMRTYIWIGVGQVGGAVDTVEQDFRVIDGRSKQREVINLLREHPNDVTLIFVAMKRTAAALVDTLTRQGLNATAIHGDMEQPEREQSLLKFRKGHATFLVATDVCARGLDIPKVNHVINYDLPENIEDYVHRIGRTGRIGRNGYATSFYVSEGTWNNQKILRGLMEILSGGGNPIPANLQDIADREGIRVGGKGKGKSFGGNDHRGGPSRNFKVSTKGGSGGKGKGKGGGGGGGGYRGGGGDHGGHGGGGSNGYSAGANGGYRNDTHGGYRNDTNEWGAHGGSRTNGHTKGSNGTNGGSSRSQGGGYASQKSDGPPDRSTWGRQPEQASTRGSW